jgi:hypothetical protein
MQLCGGSRTLDERPPPLVSRTLLSVVDLLFLRDQPGEPQQNVHGETEDKVGPLLPTRAVPSGAAGRPASTTQRLLPRPRCCCQSRPQPLRQAALPEVNCFHHGLLSLVRNAGKGSRHLQFRKIASLQDSHAEAFTDGRARKVWSVIAADLS